MAAICCRSRGSSSFQGCFIVSRGRVTICRSNHMKITAIETLVCHARMRNWVFVKVVTDQPGFISWGESDARVAHAQRRRRHRRLIALGSGRGSDGRRTVWQMMWRQHFWHGSGIVRGTAIAGIDLALWDIIGKVHGVPCHKLWGGPVRDQSDCIVTWAAAISRPFTRLRGQCAALCRPGPASGRRGLFSVQGDGGATNDADRGI